tara:strand:+ start:351 stop:536 length:186 start_codon:yes stop_codon:yes gene_type:complete
MPILRNTTSKQANQTEEFHNSVSSRPMAMSMMVDSMVSMMKNNLDQTQANTTDSANDSYEY